MRPDDPLWFATAREIAHRIRRGSVGAVECLESFARRVEEHNPALRAIVVFAWDRAFERAAAADRAHARGESWGPLHGVPVTVKESFDLAGAPTTCGDPALAGRVASVDDAAVQRLEAAGAVVFGKTNVPPRMRDVQTANDVYGVTCNPWNPGRTPGGSSGGSAAALAAGLTGLELGSDLGGSIRIPASFCGVFGHRPTAGRIRASRLGPPDATSAPAMAVAGPLARSADDLALALRVLETGDDREQRPPRPARDLRLALWCGQQGFEVEHDILEVCEDAARRLARLGATVDAAARPAISPAHAHDVFLLSLDVAGDPLVAGERTRLRDAWRDFFRGRDALIAPVAPTVAPAHDASPVESRTVRVAGREVPYLDQLFWCGLASAAGLPATTFPAGTDREGLPIGLQVIGAPGADELTIDLAGRIAREMGGFRTAPGFA